MRIVRQGDVLLVATTRKASGSVIESGNSVTLALGEMTGHSHQAVALEPAIENRDDVPPMQLFQEPDGRRLLVINRDAELRHEEHGRIGLPVGGYEVVQQVEYTPEAIRNVAD